MKIKPIRPYFLPSMSVKQANQEIASFMQEIANDDGGFAALCEREMGSKEGGPLSCNNPNCNDKDGCAMHIALGGFIGLLLTAFDLQDDDVIEDIIDKAAACYSGYRLLQETTQEDSPDAPDKSQDP